MKKLRIIDASKLKRGNIFQWNGLCVCLDVNTYITPRSRTFYKCRAFNQIDQGIVELTFTSIDRLQIFV